MVKRGGEKPGKPKRKKIRRGRQNRQAGRGEAAPGRPGRRGAVPPDAPSGVGGAERPGAGWGAVTLPATFAGDSGASEKKRWGRELPSGFQPAFGKSNPTFSSFLSLLVGSLPAAAPVSSHQELRQPSRESDTDLSTAANHLRGGRSRQAAEAKQPPEPGTQHQGKFLKGEGPGRLGRRRGEPG